MYYDEGRAFVYVAKDGIAIKTPIETGVDDANDIEVVSGLSADDQVIVNWSAQLQDKAAVNVTKTAEKMPVNISVDDENTEKITDTPVPEGNAGGDEEVTASEPDSAAFVETTTKVNIRKDPTTDSEKLETVQKGTRFIKAGDITGGWTKIIYNDGEAYIKSDYVRECE